MWRAWLANALSGLKRTWPDVAIIALLTLVSLWVRRLTLLDIEAGGDAVRKWFFVKQWLYADSFRDFEWNHHLARFGINAWVFLVQVFWGSEVGAYYIAPVAVATLGVVFTYKLGQELAGRYAGLLAALWFLTMEPMERLGSQLLPDGFSATYVAGAIYVLLLYVRHTGAAIWRRVLLVSACLLLFCAYLAKESNLLFVPAFVFVIWYWGNSRKDVLIAGGLLVGLFLLETAWYALFTEHTTRFEIVSQSHRGGTVKDITRVVRKTSASAAGARRVDSERVLDVVLLGWKLLERYKVLWESIKFPLFLFFGTSLGLAVFLKHRAARVVALLVFSYLLFATFSIRQLSPLKAWMSNEPRYFVVLCPLLFAVNAAFLVELGRRGRAALSPKLKRLALPLHGRFAPAWALLFTLLVMHRYYETNGKQYLTQGFPLRHLARHQAMFADAYARGLPIVERRSKLKKALRLIYSIYLPERLIKRGDRLPPFEEAVKSLDSSNDWLSKDPAGLKETERVRVRQDKGCVFSTQIRGRNLSVQPATKLPSRCTGRGARPG